jgi:CheY-like chemotaxis protein
MNAPATYTNPTSMRHNGRVLVVDDEPHVLAVAKTILDSQTFEVSTCESGTAAIELVHRALSEGQRFGVIILDLTMPGGMSGFEVLEGILSIDPDVAVIACSGYFQEDALDLCQAIGFADVLNKPYAMEHLCSMVRRHLARERSANSSSI